MKFFFKYIFVLSILIFFENCARKGRPSGGKKDRTPPKLIQSFPENGGLNFKGKEIKLVFDEYIQLKNIRKNLLISPPVRQMPIITPMGFAAKEIIIKFEDSLQKNTTYLINFGGSIVDNNEGNKYGNLQFVFSTGTKIDTLKLSGKVNSLHFEKAPKNIFIGLYPHEKFKDSNVFKIPPYYIAKVQKNGNFSLTHIKDGIYDMIALADENRNYVYNPKTDAIGFLKKEVNIPKDSVISIGIFKEKMPFSLTDIKQLSANHVEIKYSGSLDNFKVENELPPEKKIGFHQNNIYHFWYQSQADSIKLRIVNADYKKIYAKKRKQNKDSLVLHFKGRVRSFLDTLQLQTSIPVVCFDKSKIQVLKDSLAIPFDIKKRGCCLYLLFKKELGQSYKTFVFPNAVTDFLGNKNKDTLQNIIKLKPANAYGNIKLHIENLQERNIFIELLNTSRKIVRKSITQTEGNFDFLTVAPGKYTIRIVLDENRNNIWDTGDYLQHKLPENIVNFSAGLEVRANWDIDQTFKLP